MMSRSSLSGFTLVEMLIVIVLIGLTSSIVLPAMHQQVDKVRGKSEILKLKRIIHFAKYHAHFSGKSLSLVTKNAQVSVFDKHNAKPLRVFNFESVTFPEQTLKVNTRGLAQVIEFNYFQSGQLISTNAL